jgi:K+-sensing histidine kinase KdpD
MSLQGTMSQQLATQSLGLDSLQQLQRENVELQKYLAAQKVVIASLERRVGRSLEALGIHLQQLTVPSQNEATWNTHLSSVQSEVDCLCDLISDTMLLQKLEAGKVEVKCEPLDLHTLLTATTRHLLNAKNGSTVRLVCETSLSLPLAFADHELTEAVVTDLLARGLKYSDSDLPVVLGAIALGDRVQIRITAQRFSPPGNRDFATEIALCCRRIEVQQGEIDCQHHPDGLQTVTIDLPAIEI